MRLPRRPQRTLIQEVEYFVASLFLSHFLGEKTEKQKKEEFQSFEVSGSHAQETDQLILGDQDERETIQFQAKDDKGGKGKEEDVFTRYKRMKEQKNKRVTKA